MRFYSVNIASHPAEDPMATDDGEDIFIEAETPDDAELNPAVYDAMSNRAHRIGCRQHVARVHKAIKWVNAYMVDREYGGPEEGGWWYDWYKCMASAPVRNTEEAELIGSIMREALAWDSKHDRFSVIGGPDYTQRVEIKKADSESTERPHYE